MYTYYRFSKDSNYMTYEEWLSVQGFKSKAMYDIYESARAKLFKMLEMYKYQLATEPESKKMKARYRKEAEYYQEKYEKVQKRILDIKERVLKEAV